MDSPPPANAEQIAAWNDPVGKIWVNFQVGLDALLAPIGAAVLDALEVQPGQAIVDVGCGAGASALALAAKTGPSGRVVGVDVSAPLLALARGRPVAPGSGALAFLEADAQIADLPGPFDRLHSRFGVMFFDDPERAFANLHRAMAAKGRLAFACWRAPAENRWMTLPLEAAADLVAAPEPGDPHAPGPFAFADIDRVRTLLEGAGWTGVTIAPLDVAIGDSPLIDSARLMTRVGPLGAALRAAGPDPALVAAAEARVARALEAFETNGRVRVPSAAWIVTARAAGA